MTHARAVLPDLLDFVARTGFPAAPSTEWVLEHTLLQERGV